MKKIIIITIYTLFSIEISAQTDLSISAKGEKAIGVNVSYGKEIDDFGIGLNGLYNFTNTIQGEVYFDYFFKTDDTSLLDAGINLHFLFPIGNRMRIYPLVGFTISTWMFDLDDDEMLEDDDSWTESKFGINIGGGYQYDLSARLHICVEAKYQLISDYDQPAFKVGLAYKF